MKNYRNIALVLVVAFLASSFTIVDNMGYLANTKVKNTPSSTKSPSTKDTKKIEQREVGSFSSVDLSIAADVYVTQGNTHSLEVQASEDALQNLITRVEHGELIIKWKYNDYSNGEVVIKITMQDIDGFSIAGSGNIFCNSKVHCNDLDLSIAGSGDIKMKDLEAGQISSSIAGSGNITLGGNGKVDSHEISIAGSGDVSAKKLETNRVEVSVAGSGDCYVHVIEKLEVSIVGSGDVYYFGSPKVESSVLGSGDIEKL